MLLGNECAIAVAVELILRCFIVVGLLCLPAEDDNEPNKALSPNNVVLVLLPILIGFDED